MKLGEFIRDIRIRQHISLREFCLVVGISPALWSKVERHDAYLTEPTTYLPKIADLFNLDLDVLSVLYKETLLVPLRVLTDDEKLMSVLPAFPHRTGDSEQDNADLRAYVKTLLDKTAP